MININNNGNGVYNGVYYIQRRLCDVLDIPSNINAFFILNLNNEIQGNYYQSIASMERIVNQGSYP